MSWCRWSSDGFRSDIYCYESIDEIVIHIAARRFPDGFDIGPSTPDKPRGEGVETVPIGLPLDGQTITVEWGLFATEDEACEHAPAELRHLQEMGYHVPEWVFDER